MSLTAEVRGVRRWCVPCRMTVTKPAPEAECPRCAAGAKVADPLGAAVCSEVCRHGCGVVVPVTRVQEYGGQRHLRGECPKCGRFIRYMPSGA